MPAEPLLLSFYGDDLTGSTDVMEALALRGVDCLRVHDVRATRDALAVVAAMETAEKGTR